MAARTHARLFEFGVLLRLRRGNRGEKQNS
jgi:hypothetical protein